MSQIEIVSMIPISSTIDQWPKSPEQARELLQCWTGAGASCKLHSDRTLYKLLRLQQEQRMMTSFGSPDLHLPDELREPLHRHVEDLRQKYLNRGWGNRVGFGECPALIVIDLAHFWTRPENQIGTDADSIVEHTCRILAAARFAEVPIFFTTFAYDPADPPSPQNRKLRMNLKPGDEHLFELDERLQRRPTEKLICKRYASAFKGTNLHEMLASLRVDTLIVTGVSTSHCVYATCRDATDSFHVIVPREAVGERCELMHEVNLLDIDIDLGDVMPVDEVTAHLQDSG